MHRRRFIKATFAAGTLAAPVSRAIASQSGLPKTPRDYEGPYYPATERHRTNELILAPPRDRVLLFRGRVQNVHGEPIPRALVDIWQADPLGRYNHPRDRSPGERWDDFLYWGEAFTTTDGSFEFRTYVPGGYGVRPPHIHYKIWRNRQRLLTSQVYFRQTGGSRGRSRSSSADVLQTVSLQTVNDNTFKCELRVVV